MRVRLRPGRGGDKPSNQKTFEREQAATLVPIRVFFMAFKKGTRVYQIITATKHQFRRVYGETITDPTADGYVTVRWDNGFETEEDVEFLISIDDNGD